MASDPNAASAACTCQPKGGLPHGEHPYDYGYDDPADCPVHGGSAANHRDATLYAHGKEYVWRHSAALEGLVLTVKDVFEFRDGFTIRAEGEDGEWVIDVALPDDYGVWFAANEAAA